MSTARQLNVRIERHEVVGSTNERALELAGEGAPEGTVVVAQTQTRGRGRRGRVWHDAPGTGLLMSVVLRPSVGAEALPLLALLAGTAAAEAVREVAGVGTWTKWPNDVVGWSPDEGFCKIGGVLVERQPGCAVVGIGINVLEAPDSAGEGALPAASIAGLGGTTILPEALLQPVLAKLGALYGALEAGDAAGVVARHRALDMTVGQTVTFAVEGEHREGVATGISEVGALLVQTGEGMVEITAGEVTIRIAGKDRGH